METVEKNEALMPEIVKASDYGLDVVKAKPIMDSFAPKIVERDGLVEVYNLILTKDITPELVTEANELRKKLVKVRTGIAAIHKSEKDFYLQSGKYVDALKNKLTLPVEQMEEKLNEVITHYERIEAEKAKVLHNERVGKLIPFGYQIGTVDFSTMDENMFNAILVGAEKTYNDRIEAERKAEEARIEAARIEAEEKEKQRLELERLRKENEEKEKRIELERIEAAKKEAELKAKADAELAEANRLAKIEADKQAKIIAEQKAEAERLAAELKAKADAEEKERVRIADEQKAKMVAEKKAAKAPDKDKLKKIISDAALVLPKDGYKTPEAEKIETEILNKFNAFRKWANELIETI